MKKYIKSFLKKMAILIDMLMIFIGFIKFMEASIDYGSWIRSILWVLFMLVFIAIAWVYLEKVWNK